MAKASTAIIDCHQYHQHGFPFQSLVTFSAFSEFQIGFEGNALMVIHQRIWQSSIKLYALHWTYLRTILNLHPINGNELN